MTPAQLEQVTKHARFALGWRMMHYDNCIYDTELALVLCHFSESNRKALVSLAQAGWDHAHVCLCDMAKYLTERGDILPMWLQEYVVSSASRGKAKRPKRGRDPLLNIVRDTVIGQALYIVIEHTGLRATRNAATNSECACSIVAKILEDWGIHMSEAAVATIWRSNDWSNTFTRYPGISIGQDGAPMEETTPIAF